uniref:Trace amine-associated receptor 13c-like n=1 Tax=Oryzias melastigma TaxID=30732 RepID=A0A3B3BKR4_ORYME
GVHLYCAFCPPSRAQIIAHMMVLQLFKTILQLHSPTNTLLLSLAVSDFLTSLILMPAEIIRNVPCWFLGDAACSLYNSLSFVLTSASVGNMVLISVDRYVAVCDPLHYPTKVTDNRVKLSVCLCWLCSVFYGTLIVKEDFANQGRYRSCYGECVVTVDYIEGTIDLVVSFIAPVFVIVVLYMRVFVVAVSQARAMRSHVTAVTLQPPVTQTVRKSELKAARTLGVLVVVFLMCFCPYYCISLAADNLLNHSFASYSIFLFYLNSTFNPVVYALFYPWFRKAVKLVVTLQILQPGSCDTNVS